MSLTSPPTLSPKIVDEEIPTDAKLAFFNETRHAYGRTALLLSGDVTALETRYYHCTDAAAETDDSDCDVDDSGSYGTLTLTCIPHTLTLSRFPTH